MLPQDPFISMRAIRVHFSDGTSLETNINGTRASILKYYIGQRFEHDECKPTVECTSVEFLDSPA